MNTVSTMKIALAQIQGYPEVDRNLELADDLCARSTAAGALLLAFPEMFMAVPVGSLSLVEVAEGLDGPFCGAMRQLAKRHGLALAFTLWEATMDEQRVANTAVMITPHGEVTAAYRKLHLFDALSVKESDTMAPGSELPPVVEIAGFKIGLAICYDLRFPELFRDLAFRGAELILVLSAWYAGLLKEDHWLKLLAARAIENVLYVAGVNQTGYRFCGRSALFDPFGVPRAGAGEAPELLVVEINRERVREVRSRLPALEHVRKDLFIGNKA